METKYRFHWYVNLIFLGMPLFILALQNEGESYPQYSVLGFGFNFINWSNN